MRALDEQQQPRPLPLVVVRAGDSSLHPSWLPPSGQRSWDLVVNYFGDDPHRHRSQPRGGADRRGTPGVLHRTTVARSAPVP